jgi:DNA-binding CsgD family transcriptional regulator
MGDLVGRDTELAHVAELVAGAAEQGGALLVTGPPGIGKSELLAAAVGRARHAGHLVLSTVGVESELPLPFAGLHQVLAPVLHLVAERPGPQRRALLAAFGEQDEGPAPDPFLIALGALNLLAAVAEQQPVLIACDDAHWLDQPSQDALAFVSRRLGADPIALVATVRDGHDSAVLRGGLPRIELAPLDELAARSLLNRFAADLGAPDREAILREAEGNPLALVELPAARRRAEGSRRQAPPLSAPLTDRLEQAFAGRLTDLPADTRAALLTAAVDDEDGLREVLAAAAVLTGAPVGVEALDAAAAVHLVTFDGWRLRFRHPLVRSAIVGAEPAGRLLAAHAALAEVLAAEPFRALWHRAQSITGFDDAVAEELTAAHVEALRRGSVLSAIRILERAAELTTDSAARGRRLLLAAEHAFGLGDAALVAELLRSADRTELTELDRARMTWLAESYDDGVPGDPEGVFRLCDLAGQAEAAGDRDLAFNLLVAASLRCWWADPGPAARARVVEVCLTVPGARTDARGIAAIATADPVRRATLVVEMLDAIRLTHDVDPNALRLLGQAAHAIGDPPRSVDLLARSAAALREQGRLGLMSHVTTMQIPDLLLMGDFDRAARTVAEASRIAVDTGQPGWTIGTATLDAIAKALRGDAAGALELADQVEPVLRERRLVNVMTCMTLARGIAAIGQGRFEAAFTDLRRLFDPSDTDVYHEREGFDGLMFLAEAAMRAGRLAEGRAILAAVEQTATVTPSTLLHTQLLVARALLADDSEAEELFVSALGRDLTRWPLVRARLELGYGVWLRRKHRVVEARAALRSALAALDLIGARPWADQARAELRAAGETAEAGAAATEALSETELQIARLAARGLSNREIGELLFLSPRTIGSYLYRIFPKLGVSGRGQLAARLEAVGEESPGAPDLGSAMSEH